jgi:hypothetical protein
MKLLGSLKSLITEAASIDDIKKYPNFHLAKFFLKKKSLIENINNDYNVKFLPETQFLKLEFKKKKLNFIYDKKLTKIELNLTQYGAKSNSFNFDIYGTTSFIDIDIL